MQPIQPTSRRSRNLRPHWRIFTWAILAFNALMLLWIVTGAASASHAACKGLTASDCTAAREVGGGIAVIALIFIWVAGDIILGVLWMVTRPRGRLCPACGTTAKRGVIICRQCGHNFAGGATANAPLDAP